MFHVAPGQGSARRAALAGEVSLVQVAVSAAVGAEVGHGPRGRETLGMSTDELDRPVVLTPERSLTTKVLSRGRSPLTGGVQPRVCR